jgi:hypothetical protein
MLFVMPTTYSIYVSLNVMYIYALISYPSAWNKYVPKTTSDERAELNQYYIIPPILPQTIPLSLLSESYLIVQSVERKEFKKAMQKNSHREGDREGEFNQREG